jgi:endonuclease YncB( thermonuclease family)
MSPMLKVVFGTLACLASASAVHAQNTGAATTQLDFAKDSCGNPAIESDLWYAIQGKVSKLMDGSTVILDLPDASQTLRVRLAGIAPERHGPFSKRAKEHLGTLLLNKPVEVLVNPSKWKFSGKRPQEVTGVVYLKEGPYGDVAFMLIAEGLVRVKPPQPYAMSRYTLCQYRRAQAEAQSKRLGVWQQ